MMEEERAGEPLDLETIAARAGTRVRVDETIATVAPITASTTFTYESVEGVHAALAPDGSGFAYARNANPTVASLESVVAALEGAGAAVAFGSGMAALHAALLGSGISAGDAIVAASDLYGVTRSLLGQLEELDIHTHFVDILDHAQVDETLKQTRARVLLFESISNPLLKVADVDRIAELGHRYRATVVIDNTFATPILLRPLEHGVDVVVHSATKYIAGHGDVIAGLIATSRTRTDRIRSARTVSGGILSPFEAWLTLRGIRTLPLRVRRQGESARALAEWLEGRSWVDRVYYPGLASHPQHELAERQFGGEFGGMVAFDVPGSPEEVVRLMDALRLITPGTSLGDAGSLVLYPLLTSHRTLTREECAALGIQPGLLRLSVGLESVRDLMEDLEQAARSAGLLERVEV